MVLLRLLFCTTIVSIGLAQAQSDSLRFSEEQGSLTPQRFLTATDYTLGSYQPSKWLLKANYAALPYDRNSTGSLSYTLELASEVALSPSVSAQATLGYSHQDEQAVRGYWHGRLEARWYKSLSGSKVAQRFPFTGGYWAVRWAEYLNRADEAERSQQSFQLPARQFFLTRGVQRRMFGRGFYDFSLNVGWGQERSHIPVFGSGTYPPLESWERGLRSRFIVQSEMRLGLALGSLQRNEAMASCEVFRCLEEEQRLLKLDLSRLIYLAPSHARIQLSGAYEHKIRQSAWSLNQELRTEYEYARERHIGWGGSESRSEMKSLTMRYVLEPRYYYGLRKRMASGRSANNLSGSYVALHSSNRGEISFLSINGVRIAPEFHTAIGAVWGIQKRIFERGFFDAKIGVERVLTKDFHDFILPGVNPVLDVKIGWVMSR